MNSIIPELDVPMVRVAEDQPEYQPVTVARVIHSGYSAPRGWNTAVMAFRPDGFERQLLAAGADVYIGLLTFGAPQQPIVVVIGKHAAAAVFNVPARPDDESESIEDTANG